MLNGYGDKSAEQRISEDWRLDIMFNVDVTPFSEYQLLWWTMHQRKSSEWIRGINALKQLSIVIFCMVGNRLFQWSRVQSTVIEAAEYDNREREKSRKARKQVVDTYPRARCRFAAMTTVRVLVVVIVHRCYVTPWTTSSYIHVP